MRRRCTAVVMQLVISIINWGCCFLTPTTLGQKMSLFLLTYGHDFCTKRCIMKHSFNAYTSGDSIKTFRTLGINISKTTKYNNSKCCVLLIYFIMIHLTLPEWQVSQNRQSNYAISLDRCNSSNKMIDMSTIFSHHCSQALFPN